MSPLQQILYVGAGGFLGAVLRYGVGSLVQRLAPSAIMPYATLVANVIGCLAMGVLLGLLESRESVSQPLRLFLVVGMLGGFTTFSAFGAETYALWRGAAGAAAAANVALNVLLGLGAVWLGATVSRLA